MAKTFARIFKRQTADSATIAGAVDKLAKLSATYPDLQAAAALQAALLRTMYAAPAPVQSLDISAETAAIRLIAGTPLLHGVALPFREQDLRALFLRLCASARNQSENHTSTAAVLEQAVQRGRLDLWALSHRLIGGEGSTLATDLDTQDLPAALTMTLLRLALLPFLEQVAVQLAPLRAGQSWQQGYCPSCGAWPILAEQRGLEQFRYLRCGLCTDSWEVDRIWCVFCHNRDHLQLGYVQVEGEEQKQRAATCDVCHSYLKLRSTLTPLSAPELLVEEVALAHLDLIALDKGYAPP
ncbi:MAG: formate dehydrogenase accessory protein FdhE [Chloroflexales bacterium]|nr:formate dehydrogenase accessory protein FdhE [Chloroflexales bacterium]